MCSTNNDNNDRFERSIKDDAFLHAIYQTGKAATDKMTAEGRARFLNSIMELGQIKPDDKTR